MVWLWRKNTKIDQIKSIKNELKNKNPLLHTFGQLMMFEACARGKLRECHISPQKRQTTGRLEREAKVSDFINKVFTSLFFKQKAFVRADPSVFLGQNPSGVSHQTNPSGESHTQIQVTNPPIDDQSLDVWTFDYCWVSEQIKPSNCATLSISCNLLLLILITRNGRLVSFEAFLLFSVEKAYLLLI